MELILRVLFVLSVLLSAQMALAENVVVIVHEDNSQSLSNSDIKAIYSDNIVQWSDGSSIKSFDLPLENSVREKFTQEVMGMSARETARLWANRKITNSAKNPPKIKKERLVVLSVRRYKNAIGYVSESAIAGKKGLRVITTIQ